MTEITLPQVSLISFSTFTRKFKHPNMQMKTWKHAKENVKQSQNERV